MRGAGGRAPVRPRSCSGPPLVWPPGKSPPLAAGTRAPAAPCPAGSRLLWRWALNPGTPFPSSPPAPRPGPEADRPDAGGSWRWAPVPDASSELLCDLGKPFDLPVHHHPPWRGEGTDPWSQSWLSCYLRGLGPLDSWGRRGLRVWEAGRVRGRGGQVQWEPRPSRTALGLLWGGLLGGQRSCPVLGLHGRAEGCSVLQAWGGVAMSTDLGLDGPVTERE